MARHSLRERILDAGVSVMYSQGYLGSGIRQIMAEANAPQGSFTNHFRSKEVFAAEVLERYFGHTKTLVARALGDETLRPLERLKRYFDIITSLLLEDEFTRGCLIGDFSLEAPPHSELVRQRLIAVFAEWRELFAACVREAQVSGEIATTFSADDLSDFLLASWEGAILRAKVERSAEPLERYKRIMFATVLNGSHA
jgi:TetR/AcrR family transcriptional repressor of nem operon